MASGSPLPGSGRRHARRDRSTFDSLERVDDNCRVKPCGVVKKTVKHPTVAKMVTGAIAALNNKQGSSLQAIRHYMAATYQVDPAKLKTYIRRFVKQALADGTLVQTKGRGAAGSFRLGRRVLEGAKKKKNQTGKAHSRAELRARSRRRELERSITDQEMLKTMKKIRKPVADAVRAAICDAAVPFQCIKRKFSNTLL
ncbi:hypothetical protein NP493_991g00011 [Ridgeia piscesae]|uniref:H15 domain-containing protein n=1 Tax=Ridgeia piscesae TaxID=27915 RepID=A0AAD9KIB7_RIDPI|nr:hypothetical protein NP493_991g00011 [Ridgeia piscesae]